MSAGGSYLNSNVSLISKASIRYEGTLYSINPQEATITLSNVRSYGTEDRKVDKYLAPKDTFFEYIIFKANDIKELIVDEPLNDPAIVTAQMPGSNTSNNAYPAFNSDNQQNNLPSNGLSSDAQATLNGISNNTNQATSAPSISSAGQAGDRFRSRGSTPSSHARSPVSELSSNTRQKSDLQKIMSRGQNDQRNNVRNNNQQPNQQRRGWDNNRVHNYNNQNNQNNNRRQGNYIGNNMNNNRRYQGYQNNYPNNQFNRGGFHTRRDDRISNHLNNNRNNLNRPNHPLNNNRNMRGGRKFVPNSNKKFDATLKTEFDFEKANQVFQQMVDKLEDLNISANGDKAEKSGSEDKDETIKTDIEKSTDKVDEEGNFYDKTKSFFDNISCEAIERTKGVQKRFDWKLERKLNAETFGFKVGFRPNHGFHRQPFINHNRTNQNRRFNNGHHNHLQQPRNLDAPRNNSS